MKQYKGAVFFVDILGIGSLTRGHIKLSSDDYESHGIKSTRHQNTHFFSAKLLIKFRKVLIELKKNKNVQVAQLSDCAFIWSEKPIPLIDVAIECMWELTKSGILCRGGIAYGDIVEPDQVNNRLGKFLLGEAATKAVDLERSGKGCRIFSDEALPSKISGKKHFSYEPFVGNKNPNDCLITDELRWYLFPKGISEHDFINPDKKMSLIKLMRLVALLHHSPMFRWNAFNRAGEIQLASGIETLSSGASIFTSHLDLKFSSEYLIGHLREGRNNETKTAKMRIWRSEISAIFKTKKPNKSLNRTRNKTRAR